MIATVIVEFDSFARRYHTVSSAPVTLKLPGASVLGGVPVVLLVKVLRVAPLLLLLLHLHPAGGHRRWEARGQRLKAGQLHQGHQAFCGERLVYEEVHSWTKKAKAGPPVNTGNGIQGHFKTETEHLWVLPEIPGLEGLEEGLAPSWSSSTPLERGASINMSPSSRSSQTPPIWRKWSSPPLELERKHFISFDRWSQFIYDRGMEERLLAPSTQHVLQK